MSLVNGGIRGLRAVYSNGQYKDYDPAFGDKFGIPGTQEGQAEDIHPPAEVLSDAERTQRNIALIAEEIRQRARFER